MKTNRILTVAALAAVITITPSLFAGECTTGKHASAATCTAGKDLVSVASGTDNFNTLVAAVKAAGLVETLQGKGPFTVFAPTDAAFDQAARRHGREPSGRTWILKIPHSETKGPCQKRKPAEGIS